MLLPERSIPYKTFIKTALVLALRDVFNANPDAQLRRTKVSIDYPNTAAQYPSVIVRFFEREIANAGVGHVEFLMVTDETVETELYPFRHYFYNGDIEFAITALSSRDRDLVSDALITALASSDPRWPSAFFRHIYLPTFDLNVSDEVDPTRYNFVNLNTDKIGGFGETQNPAPWLSEDQLQYQSSYRVGIFGEFYSLPPDANTPVGIVSKVNIIPYEGRLADAPGGLPTIPAYSPPDTSFDIPERAGTEDDPAEWSVTDDEDRNWTDWQ